MMDGGDTTMPSSDEFEQLREQIRLVQRLVVELAKGLGENRATSCTSCTHRNPLMHVLFYKPEPPNDPSSGHHMYNQCDECLGTARAKSYVRVEEAEFAPALRQLLRWSKGAPLVAPATKEPR